jgi:hypothetical protein
MLARHLAAAERTQLVRMFYSYAHADRATRQAFDGVLGRFQWEIAIKPWSDDEIQPGEEWEPAIGGALESADIVLLFVSNHFLRSDYCMNRELPAALDLHANGKARVVPVILEETQPDWRDLPFAKLQALPRNGRAVSTWADPADAFRDIAKGLVSLITTRGLNPATRVTWELRLGGSCGDFTPQAEGEVVQCLRGLTRDDTLSVTEMRAGSIRLLMQSTEDAFAKIRSLHDSAALSLPASWPVLDVSMLFGAHVRSGMAETPSAEILPEPDRLPEPEWMLLPSEPRSILEPKGLIIVPEGNWTLMLKRNSTTDSEVKLELARINDMFMTVLAVVGEDLWVNLAPEEHARLLPESLTGTRLGRVLLEMDLRLKRLTASLVHPDTPSGAAYWNEIYTALGADGQTGAFGSVDTFHRVWIKPGSIKAVESDDRMVIKQCVLTAECESPTNSFDGWRRGAQDERTAEVARAAFERHVLPIIQREINEGASFEQNRQMYHVIVVAYYFKDKLRDHPRWRGYFDSNRPGILPDGRLVTTTTFALKGVESEVSARSSETLDVLTRNLERAQATAGPRARETVRSSAALARALRAHGRPREAVAQWEFVVEAGRALPDASVGSVAEGLYDLSIDALAAKDPARAERALWEALAMLDASPAARDGLDIDVLESLHKLLLGQGRTEESQPLWDRISQWRRNPKSLGIPENREYHRKYMELFRHGVFFCRRNEIDSSMQKVCRTYTAGAIDFRKILMDRARNES